MGCTGECVGKRYFAEQVNYKMERDLTYHITPSHAALVRLVQGCYHQATTRTTVLRHHRIYYYISPQKVGRTVG